MNSLFQETLCHFKNLGLPQTSDQSLGGREVCALPETKEENENHVFEGSLGRSQVENTNISGGSEELGVSQETG